MRNLTLAVDDDLLADYRLLAAEQRTTVNALVRKHMEEATKSAMRRKTALDRMMQLSRESEAFDAANPVGDTSRVPGFNRSDAYTGRRFDWPRS